MAKKATDPQMLQLQELQQELLCAAQDLKSAYDKFNFVSEAELVDACVYEINALKSRYNYLLRQYKDLLGGNAPAVQIPEAEEEYMAASLMKGGNACHS
ncbi:MAG: DUF2508 family protein [Ruminococcaceae bacterium]|nr:DUF2508 family protein [Oscillospiraceae bacterium]